MNGCMYASNEAAREIDESFDRWLEAYEASGDDLTLVDEARGFFHCGASFYAFETQVLLALRHLARVERDGPVALYTRR